MSRKPTLVKSKYHISLDKDLQPKYARTRALGEAHCMRLFGCARTVLHQLDYGGIAHKDAVERVSNVLRNM